MHLFIYLIFLFRCKVNFVVVEKTECVHLKNQSWTPLYSCGTRETVMAAEMLGENTRHRAVQLAPARQPVLSQPSGGGARLTCLVSCRLARATQ